MSNTNTWQNLMTLYQHKAGPRFLPEFTDRTVLRIRCRRCSNNQCVRSPE